MLGVDIIEIDRIEKVINENPRFFDRIFTETEKDWANKYYTKRPAQHLAACWAAKEAFFKATNLKFKFGQIQVDHFPNKKPYLKPAASDSTLSNINWDKVELSISHNNQMAIAVVLVAN